MALGLSLTQLAVVALVTLLGLTVVAALTYYFQRVLRNFAKRAFKWSARARRATSRGVMKRLSRVLPYPHSVQKAVLYTIVVMVVSLAAPQLSEFIGKVLSHILRDDCVVLRNCLTISVIAGSSTAITFIFLREKDGSFANRVLERLSSGATPDGGEAPECVEFVTKPEICSLNGKKREYLNIDFARMGVEEHMIVLRQVGKGPHVYSIECLVEQLGRLCSKIEKENEKRKKENERQNQKCDGLRKKKEDSKKLEVKWVCFVSNTGRFHAFQPYKTFQFHIMVKRNSRYVDILNKTTEEDLANAIQNEINLSQRFTIKDCVNTAREAFIPDAIPDLDRAWIRKGITIDKVLEIYVRKSKSRAMLVSRYGRHNPIGVLTATDLAKLALYDPLIKNGLYTPLSDENEGESEKDDAFGELPPGIAVRPECATPLSA